MAPLLTVNIATLAHRKKPFLSKICDLLPPWASLHLDSSEGCLGDKRQAMLERSKGRYVCVIDDDDDITDRYFTTILEGIEADVDGIGLVLRHIADGVHEYDMAYGQRHPYPADRRSIIGHICPVKRDLALKVGYKSYGRGEDFAHMVGLTHHIKTAHYVNEVTYMNYFASKPKEYDDFDEAPSNLSGADFRSIP